MSHCINVRKIIWPLKKIIAQQDKTGHQWQKWQMSNINAARMKTREVEGEHVFNPTEDGLVVVLVVVVYVHTRTESICIALFSPSHVGYQLDLAS